MVRKVLLLIIIIVFALSQKAFCLRPVSTGLRSIETEVLDGTSELVRVFELLTVFAHRMTEAEDAPSEITEEMVGHFDDKRMLWQRIFELYHESDVKYIVYVSPHHHYDENGTPQQYGFAPGDIISPECAVPLDDIGLIPRAPAYEDPHRIVKDFVVGPVNLYVDTLDDGTKVAKIVPVEDFPTITPKHVALINSAA